jgi:hypothetical protein
MTQDPLAPIEGITLTCYAAIRRALVRLPSGARNEADAFLEANGMSPGSWARVEHAWSERIRESRVVRAAFRELYARPIDGSARGN